jgi:hypothetical protein
MKNRSLMIGECKKIKKIRIQHFFYKNFMDNLEFRTATYKSITESFK